MQKESIQGEQLGILFYLLKSVSVIQSVVHSFIRSTLRLVDVSVIIEQIMEKGSMDTESKLEKNKI